MPVLLVKGNAGFGNEVGKSHETLNEEYAQKGLQVSFKISEQSQISSCKKIQNKRVSNKVRLKRFRLNGDTLQSRSQT